MARRVCHSDTYGVKKVAKKLAKTLDKLSRLWYTKAIKRKEITTMTLTIIILSIIGCATCAFGFIALLFDRFMLGQVLITICILALLAVSVIAILTVGIVW